MLFRSIEGADSAAVCFKTSNLAPYGNAPTGIYFDKFNITTNGADYGAIFLPSGYTGGGGTGGVSMDPQGVWVTDCIIIGQHLTSLKFTATDQDANELSIRNCSFYSKTSYTVYIEGMGNLRFDSNTVINGTNGLTNFEYNFNGSQNGFLFGAHIMGNGFFGQGTNIAVGGTVTYGGATNMRVYVSYNGSGACSGGYAISGNAVVANNNN